MALPECSWRVATDQWNRAILRVNMEKYLHNMRWGTIPKKASHRITNTMMWRTLPGVKCIMRP
jgi:hypothetical protein